ncbi:MAG: hypothetical protein ACI9Y8_001444 [Candidatus Omnitrophota bacterium]|jgi:hypothetical protein
MRTNANKPKAKNEAKKKHLQKITKASRKNNRPKKK